MDICEDDNWQTNGKKVTSEENLKNIESTLEEDCIIVEHWFYRGASAPDRLVFDSYKNFEEYINEKIRPGDAIYIWKFSQCCQDNNYLVYGKVPDEKGRVPEKGAY